ncbi:microtubule binding motor protein [Lithospermum erythrorhizon]|uniref:Microtubule binding motor protein n=1 Tax=Lithospermum erythrorhizon TaxID=34254 RepID=A0AAV3P827_LITER
MEGVHENKCANEFNGDYGPRKVIFSEMSPRSPLSTHSPDTDSMDLAMDGAIDTSIEQLYHNVCEMQSSDHSPSRHSLLSYGQESRIDSELRFLAGVNYGEVEETRDGDRGDRYNDEKRRDVDEKSTIKREPVTLEQEKGGVQLGLSSKSSPTPNRRSKYFDNKPPISKGNVSSKKLNTISSLKIEKNCRAPNAKKLDKTRSVSETAYIGAYLLKQAKQLLSSGDNPLKVLEVAQRATKSFEKSKNNEPNLDYVMCLHVIAALYCRLNRYIEAIPLLERSIEVPVMDMGDNHALAKFSGCMQLGDTYAMLGQIENSILCYTAGLEIQRQVLGEGDARFGETCRYLAEAHVQAMQFDDAEKLCLIALDIHKEKCVSSSLEEASDRRLLGLICDSKRDYEAALEHYVLASMALAANGHELDVASVDCNIGDAYLSLARYDEAISSYQKALTTFKAAKGEKHPSIASVFVRLADLYNKIGKFSESKSYCKKALHIYTNPVPGSPADDIASGLVDVSAIFESMDKPDQALKLLQKALKVYGNAPGQQSTIAGIEAQMGVLYYMMGSYTDSYNTLKEAITKFRSIGEKKSALLGIALNQIGLACVQLYAINEAADYFEESRIILEAEYGPHHTDTIGVYSNLAGTYDAMGRTSDAIEILEFVVDMREEKLGTASTDVDDERRRLTELLREAGRVRSWKSRSLETLFVKSSSAVVDNSMIEVS